jgi:hypothetical protein
MPSPDELKARRLRGEDVDLTDALAGVDGEDVGHDLGEEEGWAAGRGGRPAGVARGGGDMVGLAVGREAGGGSRERQPPEPDFGHERITPSTNRDGYLTESEQGGLRQMLYPYLKDKLQRRGEATGRARMQLEEGAALQEKTRGDKMALLAGLSDAGAGTLYGKRAESNIIPNYNAARHKNWTDARDSISQGREMEERSLTNDLNIGRAVAEGEGKEKERKDTVRNQQAQRDYLYDVLKETRRHNTEAEKRIPRGGAAGAKRESSYAGPDGGPLVFDPSDGSYAPGNAPAGSKRVGGPRGSDPSGAWRTLPGVTGPNGALVERNPKTGETRVVPLPDGAARTSKGGFGPDGKALSPHDIGAYGKGREAIRGLSDLETKFAKWKPMMGPVEGRLKSMNPWNEDAQKFQADLKRNAQTIGAYMEGGVLRKEDEVKYEKMLPTLADTPPVAEYKLGQVRKMLLDKQEADMAALKAQGYKTQGLGSEAPAEETKIINGVKYKRGVGPDGKKGWVKAQEATP